MRKSTKGRTPADRLVKDMGLALNDYAINIYVGGKWSDNRKIGERIKYLEDLGFSITHNWTKTAQRSRDPGVLSQCAIDDIEGVKSADIVLLFMEDPEYSYRGTFTELGCALAYQNKGVILVCPDAGAYCRTNCFFHHPMIIHSSSWEDALTKLDKLVGF